MFRMRRRNINKLIIIIYVVDLSTFNESSSSIYNDDLNLFEKERHAHVQTFSLNLFFIFLFSISLVNFSLSCFKYNDYDSNVNMIEKMKHDTKITAKNFSHEKTEHDTRIIAKDFNYEKTKHDTRIFAKDFSHSQKYEF